MTSIQQMFAEELRTATAAASAGLLEGVQNNKLPEPIFRQSFLPFFTNPNAVTPDNPVYAYWVGVAGSPTSEVDVVDESGATLFVVPALLNTNSLETLQSRHRGQSFKDMYLDYAQMSQGLAPVATNMWNNGLNEKMKDIITTDNPATSSDREKWAKIYQFYGLPTGAAEQNNQNNNEPPLEYE